MLKTHWKQASLFAVVLLVLVWFFTNEKQLPLVFVGGTVYTMDGSGTQIEAVLVEHGLIAAIGSEQHVLQQAAGAQVIDLDGRALLPGFVDAHSHFPVGVINHLGVDVSATSAKPVVEIDELLHRLSDAVKTTPDGQWIVGFNYDNTVFPTGHHPTRQQLDQITQNHPVYLRHISGHMGVANTAALQVLEIDNTDEVLAQFIGVDEPSGELNGLLQEDAAPSLDLFIRQFSIRQMIKAYNLTQQEYLAAGISTVQNGLVNSKTSTLLKILQGVGILPQRVVSWVNAEYASDNEPEHNTDFRQATVKLIVDGSPQGRTAYLTQPYQVNSSNNADFRGVPLFTQDALDLQVEQFHRAGYQLALHGNGDAAIDLILHAVERAQRLFPRPDARHILVHAQTVRDDQLGKLAALSITPSFFNTHTYYWGDWHKNETLGPERAQRISPLASAQRLGLRFSLHSDAPVTPMEPMQLLWSAINRQTRSGYVLGEQQRIDMMSALRAITIDAAWQSHVEHDRGTIEVGKLADLVVLSGDPVTVDDIRTLQVDLTYIGGKEVFRR